jgi:hypothetical protein
MLEYPFILSQPVAAMALEYCSLLYTDSCYSFLLQVIYKHQP